VIEFRDPQINIYCRDAEAMTRFYTEVLGFEETFRVPKTGAPDHVEVRLGNLVLGFASVEAVAAHHGFDASRDETRSEVALWVDSCDEAYSYLVAHGASTISPPHDFIGVLRGAWVADPEGNPIQVVSKL
jgi:catechol 2,3-dioxygenase-like lactoylglutathione lyase family enzyme